MRGCSSWGRSGDLEGRSERVVVRIWEARRAVRAAARACDVVSHFFLSHLSSSGSVVLRLMFQLGALGLGCDFVELGNALGWMYVNKYINNNINNGLLMRETEIGTT